MIWLVIPSFPDYEVSEFGNIRRCRPGIRGGFVGKVMKPYIRQDGYCMYILRRDNRSFHRKAHQLVAETFLGSKPFPEAEVLCHTDGSRTNDHFTNLRWDSSAGNKADMIGHGTRLAGERHPLSKISADQIREIKKLCANGVLQRKVAERYGIAQGHVSRILNGMRWASEVT